MRRTKPLGFTLVVLTYKEAIMEIKSIKKEDREDIDNYLATLENGEIIGVEASSEKEAKAKIKEYLKNRDQSS